MMTARLCVLGLALLLAACGSEQGMRCKFRWQPRRKAQVAGMKAGWDNLGRGRQSLGKRATTRSALQSMQINF
jgi:hypothetical protein